MKKLFCFLNILFLSIIVLIQCQSDKKGGGITFYKTITVDTANITKVIANGVNFTGTVAKGVNFAGITPSFGADTALVSIGSWSTPLVITGQTTHFVPLQVNLQSNSSTAHDIAAARFRVNTGAANTATALDVVQIRSSVAHNVASIGTFGAGLSLDNNFTVNGGEIVAGGFSIAGSGKATITGGNLCKVFEAENWNTSSSESVTHVGYFGQKGTGSTVRSMVTCDIVHGTATKGLEVVNTSGTLTTGIVASGTMTTGIDLSGATTTTGIALGSNKLTTTGIISTGVLTVASDTSTAAVVPGNIVYQASDSTFYGCRYKRLTGKKKWWALDH